MHNKVHDKNEAEYEPAPLCEKPSSRLVPVPGGGNGKQRYLLTWASFLVF